MMRTGKSRLLWAMITVFSLVIFGVGCQALSPAYEFKGSRLDPPLSVPDFALTDTGGKPFQLSDAEADFTLVYFGYTYCPDVCPLTLWDVKEALADLEGRERIQVVFISVDPERDTPEVLERYLAAFDSDIIGLTDDFEEVEKVMKPFGAFAEKEEVADSAAGYLMSHTARLYLINDNQEIMLTYPFGFEADDLHSDLTHLLQQT